MQTARIDPATFRSQTRRATPWATRPVKKYTSLVHRTGDETFKVIFLETGQTLLVKKKMQCYILGMFYQ